MHLAALRHQLAQVYYGFALALATNRTLVLPRLQCYCAKNWYMTESCRILGEKATVFPFACSLGDFIKPRKVVEGLPVQDRNITVREHSFLSNPRTPEAVKASVAVIKVEGVTAHGGGSQQPGPEGHGPSSLSSGLPAASAAAARQVWLPAGLDEQQAADQLAAGGLADVRVLHIHNASALFSDFSDGELKIDFEAKLDWAATYWCCRSPQDISRGLPDREKLRIRPLAGGAGRAAVGGGGAAVSTQ